MAGNAYVTGDTSSINFPTVNARYPNYGGGVDVFVTKFDPQGGGPVYSTYLGGSQADASEGDNASAIAVDRAGNAYVAGRTNSFDFPTANARYPNYGGASDAFVTKFNSQGQGPVYSTYLGGSNQDEANAITLDGTGDAYVTGGTCSSDFPAVNALYPNLRSSCDAFVTKFDPRGQGPAYSTYLGGISGEDGYGIAVDRTGNAYVTGYTESTDFPTVNARYPNYRGGENDAFVTKIADTGLPSGAVAVVDLQVLDAIDFRSGATISSDPITLGDRGKGRSMNGVATDGLAQLVLRARTNHPGTVTFSIAGADGGATGNPTEDGQLLSRYGSQPGNNTLAVVAEPIVYRPGEYYAFARYLAPETFPRASVPTDLSAAHRQLRLRVQFAPNDGTPPPAQPLDRLLTLERPPVVLIHGFASSSETWSTFIAKLRQRIPGIAVDAKAGDYRNSNLAHFSENERIPPAAVSSARKAYQDRGLATIQADVFGHSMGGVLSRIAASRSWYRNVSNYQQGWLSRISRGYDII